MDRFYPGDEPGTYTVFHLMDLATKFSCGAKLDSASLSACIELIEMLWVSQNGRPNAIAYDQAFDPVDFKSCLNTIDVQHVTISTRTNNKNVLEGKHKVLRERFTRLCVDKRNYRLSTSVKMQQMFRISNLSYINECLSAFELAKGYSPLVLLLVYYEK